MLEQSQREVFFSLGESGFSKGMNESLLKGDASGFALHLIPDLVVPPFLAKAFTRSFGTHCFPGLIFCQLNWGWTNTSHRYTGERCEITWTARGKKLRFPLYGAIKPVGSVQTSHEISPRLNWNCIKPKTSRGIPLTLWKHTKPKSLLTQ